MITINANNGFNQIKLNPAQFLVLGFAGLILIGATLLNLPFATQSGKSIGFIDSLFTSSSAVCVTGLVVVNTAEYWSVFGKVVILLLIQIGGLGIMSMATLVAMLLGKKITLKERLIIQEELNHFSLAGLVKLIRYVITSTLIIEGIGAIILAFRFIPEYGYLQGIGFSIFHSISAFCNAGFDLIGNSMESFVGDPIINIVIGLLVIVGGLGYTVYIDITTNKRFKAFSLHTKFVLMISGVLLLFGFLFVFILEFNNPETLGGLSLDGKIWASWFQSLVPRTAGFNSVNMGAVTDATAFLIIIFMFIGGSPSSTAGGVKTTTVGALVLGMVAVIRGRDDVEFMKRRISNDLIFRALAVVGIGFGIVILVTMILTITETESTGSFLDLLFEATSAFGTVGLSRGVTPNLSVLGRLVVTLTMFIGRIGPLTMAFAFAKKKKYNKGNYRFPEERILVG